MMYTDLENCTKIVIGIDPGRHTGICILGSLGKKKHPPLLYTTSFWGCVGKLLNIKGFADLSKAEMHVYIEDPNINKPVFIPWNGEAQSFNLVAARHPESMRHILPIALRKSQDVGSNKRDARLLMEFMDVERIAFTAVRPGKKLAAKEFGNITGYKKRTSQHERDAMMLAFGR